MSSHATRPAMWPGAGMVGAVAAGGAVGALLRYGCVTWAGYGPGGSAGVVLAINVIGSFVMGLLVVWALRRHTHRLLRPFLGTGVLGGFTTFSTYAADTRELLSGGLRVAGIAYLILTPVLAITACWLGVEAMHRVVGGQLPTEPQSGDL